MTRLYRDGRTTQVGVFGLMLIAEIYLSAVAHGVEVGARWLAASN